MRVYLVGENSITNSNIISYINKKGIKLDYYGVISSNEKLEEALLNANSYDIVILDVNAYFGMGDEIVENTLAEFSKNYSGTVICYIPGAGDNNFKVNMCKRLGFTNLVLGGIGFVINKELDNIFKSVSSATDKQTNFVENTNYAEESIKSDVSNDTKDKEHNNYADKPQINRTPNISFESRKKSNSTENVNNKTQVTAEEIQDIEPSHTVKNETTEQNTVLQQENSTVHNEYAEETVNENSNSNESGGDNQFNPIDSNLMTDSEIKVEKTIGVIGVMPRIGVTSQSILLVKFLQSIDKRACYVQNNDKQFIENMETYFEDVEIDNERVVFDNIDFFKNTSDSFGINYDYKVFDFGSVNNTVPTDFFNKNIRVIVCGGSAEEVSKLTELVEQIYHDESIIYLFSFVPEYEQDDIREMMGERSANCYFVPYSPDCFYLSDSSIEMYNKIFNIEDTKKSRKRRKKKRK